MIRQRFATRITTKRAFIFNLEDDDPKPKEKTTVENNSTGNEIDTPDIPDVDSNKNEKVENVGKYEEDFCTPNSPLNCTGVLNQILKHPPLGTSTPRIPVPQKRPKQSTHNPKSLFNENTSSKLSHCSPIRKLAIIKPSSQISSSTNKTTTKTSTSQKKIAFNSQTETVPVQSASSPVQDVQNVPESPDSPNSETNFISNSPEVVVQNMHVQDSMKAFEAQTLTKNTGLRSPKVNKVAKLRPRSDLSSPVLEEVPAHSILKPENEQTPTDPKIKHITLSKSAIKQVSIDSDSPFPENNNSNHKVISPRKSMPDVPKVQNATQGNKSAKKSKGTKSNNKVPREVKLLMEQCYKMENLKSHYHSDTGEVEFEQYTRSHKPICYNVDTMLAKFDNQSVPKKRAAKSKFVVEKGQPKPKKSTKNRKKKTTSKSSKNIPEDSGNSSSSFIIKRKKSATKIVSDDDGENIYREKKRKVSNESDSGYCKETGGTKDPKRNPSAVRSKRSLYTRNDVELDYDISPSTSTTSNEKHFIKSMQHLVKKTDFHKLRKPPKRVKSANH